MTRGRITLVTAMLWCVAVVSGGCATPIAGSPDGGPSITADSGNYPTTPRSVAALTIDGQRVQSSLNLAHTLVSPTEIDDPLTEYNGAPDQAIDASDLRFFFGVPFDPLAQGLLAGYATGRRSARTTASALVAAFRYSTPEEANRAVDSISAARNDEYAKRSALAGHPRSIPVTAPNGFELFDTWMLAHHEFVVIISSRDVSASTPTALMTRQLASLDEFTGSALFADPPAPDPEGVLALTIPIARDSAGTATSRSSGSYTPRAWIQNHEEFSWTTAVEIYERAGVEAVGSAANIVYRTRTADGARLLFGHALPTPLPEGFRREASIPGITASGCTSRTTTNGDRETTHYRCAATSGRFLVEAYARSLADAQQKVAAGIKTTAHAARSEPSVTANTDPLVKAAPATILPTQEDVARVSGQPLAAATRTHEKDPDSEVAPRSCLAAAQPTSTSTWDGSVANAGDKYTKLVSGQEAPKAISARAATFDSTTYAGAVFRRVKSSLDACRSFTVGGKEFSLNVAASDADYLAWTMTGPAAVCTNAYARVRNMIVASRQCSATAAETDASVELTATMVRAASR